MADLERMVRLFVTKTCISKGIDSHAAKQAGGKICVSGSYRLGINEPDADIDAVCFVPRHVSREDFFTTLYKMLDDCDDVTDLKPPIRDARVPLMNLVFRDIEIDLIMARLPVERVDKDLDIRFDEILKGVEVTEIRSINGPRDNEVLSDLVHNFENFKIVLRAVRRHFTHFNYISSSCTLTHTQNTTGTSVGETQRYIQKQIRISWWY